MSLTIFLCSHLIVSCWLFEASTNIWGKNSVKCQSLFRFLSQIFIYFTHAWATHLFCSLLWLVIGSSTLLVMHFKSSNKKASLWKKDWGISGDDCCNVEFSSLRFNTMIYKPMWQAKEDSLEDTPFLIL